MNSKKLAILGLLILVISMSGCLNRAKTCGLTVSQTEGILIKRLEPSYFMVPVDDEIKVYMDVQNRGNSQATNVKATLWAHAGFSILQDSASPYDKAGTYVINYPLEAPRLDICSEGDVYTFEWALKAGCDPVETILAVYLDYDYSSYGYAKIPLASREQYERTQGKLKAEGENFPSAGPIQVKIESIQAEPVLISETSNDFSVRAIFTNTGPGLAGPKGMGDVGKVTMSLSGPCEFTKRNKYTMIDGEEKDLGTIWDENDKKRLVWPQNTVIMRSGDQEAMKIAYLEYDGDPTTFVEDVCRIEISSEYHYQTVESPGDKMGVYGSPSQIETCLQG
ncbi:MAG: hypothetical protein ABIF92_01760 [archaeon]